MKEEIVAIIPARGGSKGIPRKNVKILNGKPLIYYTIKEANKSKYLDRVVVSTEDEQIQRISKKFKVEVIVRPKKLSTDKVPMESVIKHVIKTLEKNSEHDIGIVLILQPTSPLRTVRDIDGVIKKIQSTKCNSVASVSEVDTPPHWMYTIKHDKLIPILKGGDKVKRRQDLPSIFRLNGAIFAFQTKVLMEQGKIFDSDTRAYIMPKDRSVDIDSDIDFELAKILVKRSVR